MCHKLFLLLDVQISLLKSILQKPSMAVGSLKKKKPKKQKAAFLGFIFTVR